MELFLAIIVAVLVFGIGALQKGLRPRTRRTIQLTATVVLFIWVWGFDDCPFGPKLMITSIVLCTWYGLYRQVDVLEKKR